MTRRKIIGIIFILAAAMKMANMWHIFNLDWFDWGGNSYYNSFNVSLSSCISTYNTIKDYPYLYS